MGSINKQQGVSLTVDFKGAYYPKSVILHAVFFYVRYAISYRDLEEILAERGVKVDHASLNRWVVNYAPEIAANAQRRKRKLVGTWRVDETYIKVRGKWTCLYRATDRRGKPLISCSQSVAIPPLHGASSNKRSLQMATWPGQH